MRGIRKIFFFLLSCIVAQGSAYAMEPFWVNSRACDHGWAVYHEAMMERAVHFLESRDYPAGYNPYDPPSAEALADPSREKYPLHWAVKWSMYKEIRELLHYLNVNALDAASDTPLHVAAQYNKPGSIKQLCLRADIEINAKGGKGRTALHVAAENGFKEVAQLLLDGGAKINLADDNGQTPLYLAIVNGHLGIIPLLLDKKLGINEKDSDGYTLLHYAALGGYPSVIQFFLDKGLDIQARNGFGQTPLHFAADRGNSEAVQLLLGKGADVNAQTNRYATPLCLAVEGGHQNTARLLLDAGACIDALDGHGNTPFCWAFQNRHALRLIRLLYNRNAIMRIKDLREAWFYGPYNGQEAATKQLSLLWAHKIRVNPEEAKNSDGFEESDLPAIGQSFKLLECAATNNSDGVHDAIENGAWINAAMPPEFKTALHVAVCNGNMDMARDLIVHHAKVGRRSAGGNKALHYAVHMENREAITLLLCAGAKPSSKNYDGNSPIELAAQKPHLLATFIIAAAKTPEQKRQFCEYLKHIV